MVPDRTTRVGEAMDTGDEEMKGTRSRIGEPNEGEIETVPCLPP